MILKPPSWGLFLIYNQNEMTTLIISLLALFIVIGGLLFKQQLKNASLRQSTEFPHPWPPEISPSKNNHRNTSKFSPRKPLSEPEQILYWKLQKALPNHVVLAQVSFSRFLYTKGATAKDNFWQFARGRQKVADFVICDKNFYIVAIVELDDNSHSTEKDKIRDAILKEAKLHIIRWNVRKLPTEEEIQKTISLST